MIGRADYQRCVGAPWCHLEGGVGARAFDKPEVEFKVRNGSGDLGGIPDFDEWRIGRMLAECGG